MLIPYHHNRAAHGRALVRVRTEQGRLGTAIKTSPLKCHQWMGQRRSSVELRLVGVGQKRYPRSKEVFSAKGQARAFSESRWALEAEWMAAAILMWRRP